MSTSPSVPPAFARLVDDAATFPPGNAPVPDAVAAHAEHHGSWYADLVGPLVVSDQRLPELVEALRTRGQDTEPLAVTVVVAGGAGALEPALTWVGRAPELELRAVETAVRDDPGSPGGMAHNATRITTALDAIPVDVPAYVEVPRLSPAGPSAAPTPDWLRCLDVLATADVAVKLRTGGESAEAHPSEAELVACIDPVLDRELAFKATAGLHHAVRHRSPEGWEQHGFLNVVAATEALLDGAGRAAATAMLAERDPDRLVEAGSAWRGDPAPSVRRWFRSFGSCSITDPVDDLVALGLLDRPRAD